MEAKHTLTDFVNAKDCRSSIKDLNYKGHINTTRNGHTCRYWKDGTKYRTEENNYCRTPSGAGNNAEGPWCFTSNGWDRCNVAVCGGKYIYPDPHIQKWCVSDVNLQISEDALELVKSRSIVFYGGIKTCYCSTLCTTIPHTDIFQSD